MSKPLRCTSIISASPSLTLMKSKSELCNKKAKTITQLYKLGTKQSLIHRLYVVGSPHVIYAKQSYQAVIGHQTCFLQAVVHIGSPHVVTLPFLLETACFLRGDTSLTERDIESDGMNSCSGLRQNA